jgi:hypothetical protein
MKRIVFSSLAILGIFLATGAMANNHPGTCANYRDRCKISKISGKADVCERMYQYAITHNGAWNGHRFDRHTNQWFPSPTNCTF